MLSRSVLAAAILASLGSCEEPSSRPPQPTAEPRAVDYRSPGVQQSAEAAASLIRTRGFVALEDPRRGFLVEHGADVRPVSMRSGTCYVVVATSSEAVRELDVRIFDSEGGEAARDANAGPRAALRFCPAQSGAYYVSVQASAGNGVFEARTFRGPTGLDVRIDDVFGEESAAEGP